MLRTIASQWYTFFLKFKSIFKFTGKNYFQIFEWSWMIKLNWKNMKILWWGGFWPWNPTQDGVQLRIAVSRWSRVAALPAQSCNVRNQAAIHFSVTIVRPTGIRIKHVMQREPNDCNITNVVLLLPSVRVIPNTVSLYNYVQKRWI